MYENYFFDLYGTLVDIRTDETKPSLWRGIADFYSRCGAGYSEEEIRGRYFGLCAEEVDVLARAHPELGVEGVEIELRNVFRRMFEEKGVSASAPRVEDTAVLFRRMSFCQRPRLMNGVKKTLEGLRRRGARLYLLSNAQSCFTIPELRWLGVLDGSSDRENDGGDLDRDHECGGFEWDFDGRTDWGVNAGIDDDGSDRNLVGVFDGIFLSSDFGCKKPAPQFFHAALKRAGLTSSEVLMVGNDPTADIRGADSVGMKSRYIHSWQSPPRGSAGSELPESCREVLSLEELLEE